MPEQSDEERYEVSPRWLTFFRHVRRLAALLDAREADAGAGRP